VAAADDRLRGRPLHRWGRFHLARGTSLLACVGLFPLLAPRTGSSVAYWSLLIVGAVVNFCSDKYWSFSSRSLPRARHAAGRPPAFRRVLGLLLAAVLAGLSAVLFTDAFITVRQLADAGHYVYLDAGHARWRGTGEMAQRLLQAGIQDAQGFSVNVANRQTTTLSYQWGRELSDLLGRREFIIDTFRNGLGPPPDDPARDDEWCNPRRQGLGQAPTTETTAPGLAALLWIKLPGESDGSCGGETSYQGECK
jgi:endoglucanase